MTSKQIDKRVEQLNRFMEAQYGRRGATYTVSEIQHMLKMSRSAVYRLVENAPFDVLRIDRRIRIPKESFDTWHERIR